MTGVTISDTGVTTVILLLQTYSYASPFTNTSVEYLDDDSPETEESLQTLSLILQASAAFIGFIGNVITFVVLKRDNSISSGTTLRLMKNQAVVDAIVCFIGSIFVLQPSVWKTGINETLDLLICQVQCINFCSLYFMIAKIPSSPLVDCYWMILSFEIITLNFKLKYY